MFSATLSVDRGFNPDLPPFRAATLPWGVRTFLPPPQAVTSDRLGHIHLNYRGFTPPYQTMIILANIGLTIVVIIVAVVLAIAAYFITRMMKGKLELQLLKTGLGSGETLNGTVTLTTKKPLDVRRFYVALIGHEEVERRRSGDDDRHTEKREIYRDEYNFEDGQLLPAGFTKTYEFALIAPGKDTVGGGSSGGGLELNIGPLKIGNDRRRLTWKVEARVDLPGVDLATSKSVRVNLS